MKEMPLDTLENVEETMRALSIEVSKEPPNTLLGVQMIAPLAEAIATLASELKKHRNKAPE